MTNRLPRTAAIALLALLVAVTLAIIAPTSMSTSAAATSAPLGTSALSASTLAKSRKCDYNPGYRWDSMRVKGMTCKRGKRLAGRAYVKWLDKVTGDGEGFRSSFGNFRCRHSGEYVANAFCRSKSAPKKRWFWFHAGE